MSNATHRGTCEACGREDVELREALNEDRRTGRRKFVCVEDRPCFEAWRAGTSGSQVDRAVGLLDALDASDPERAHGIADGILLANVHPHIQTAYARLTDRAPWWGGA